MIQFIIIGTMGVPWTVDSGHFHCPSCGEQREYKLRHVRRFLTLYFIPLIPLDLIGRFVKCKVCSSEFEEAILTFDPEAAHQEFLTELKRVMILMALADGEVDGAETAVIHRIYEDMSGVPLSAEQIAEEAHLAATAKTDLATYVKGIAPTLSAEAKVIVIKVAFEVASAGGTLTPGRQHQLMNLPDALGISKEDFKAIVDQISQMEP